MLICDKKCFEMKIDIKMLMLVKREYIYLRNTLLRILGGPHALRGGAKPHPQGVYPPEGLRLQDKRYVFLCLKNVNSFKKWIDIKMLLTTERQRLECFTQ
jgi:hypothetical protein